MTAEDDLKLFHVTQTLALTDLREVERRYSVDLGLKDDASVDSEESDYLQFRESLRAIARQMARHYELFFCLENEIRDMIAERLEAKFGADWWNNAVPQHVRENVEKNFHRERDAGHSLRSPEMIDYSTFGELGEIIQANWDVFSDTFNSRKALTRVLNSLNLLRGPIAHSSPLASDEVVRLRLALHDWFRLME